MVPLFDYFADFNDDFSVGKSHHSRGHDQNDEKKVDLLKQKYFLKKGIPRIFLIIFVAVSFLSFALRNEPLWIQLSCCQKMCHKC